MSSRTQAHEHNLLNVNSWTQVLECLNFAIQVQAHKKRWKKNQTHEKPTILGIWTPSQAEEMTKGSKMSKIGKQDD